MKQVNVNDWISFETSDAGSSGTNACEWWLTLQLELIFRPFSNIKTTKHEN